MRIKRRRVKRGRVEVIPLIDTIVILLIFYMTFSRFAAMAKEAAIELPKAVAGDDPKEVPGQYIINMYSSDNVHIGGNSYKVSDLPPMLKKVKADRYALGQRLTIVLRANKTMTYKDLSELMGVCAKAGIADVTFATIESTGK